MKFISTKREATSHIPNQLNNPLLLTSAVILLLVAGVFLIHRSDEQARDTIRKHHLADIERSLYAAKNKYGTVPPYNQPNWCGVLNEETNESVRKEVENALRDQNEMYGNLAKPFPSDPKFANTNKDYFYWKHSPTTFELYAVLEQDKNQERSTLGCIQNPGNAYDYGIASIWREDSVGFEL